MSEIRAVKKPFSANTATAASRMRWYFSALRLNPVPLAVVKGDWGSRFTTGLRSTPDGEFSFMRQETQSECLMHRSPPNECSFSLGAGPDFRNENLEPRCSVPDREIPR